MNNQIKKVYNLWKEKFAEGLTEEHQKNGKYHK